MIQKNRKTVHDTFYELTTMNATSSNTIIMGRGRSLGKLGKRVD